MGGKEGTGEEGAREGGKGEEVGVWEGGGKEGWGRSGRAGEETGAGEGERAGVGTVGAGYRRME